MGTEVIVFGIAGLDVAACFLRPRPNEFLRGELRLGADALRCLLTLSEPRLLLIGTCLLLGAFRVDLTGKAAQLAQGMLILLLIQDGAHFRTKLIGCNALFPHMVVEVRGDLLKLSVIKLQWLVISLR